MALVSFVQSHEDGSLDQIEEIEMEYLPRAGDTLTFRLEHATYGYEVERNEFLFDHTVKQGDVAQHYESELVGVRCFVRSRAAADLTGGI